MKIGNKGLTLLRGRHVFVVLEYNTGKQDPKLHAVFSKREYAEAKAEKLRTRHKAKGYIAVLKQRILGSTFIGVDK